MTDTNNLLSVSETAVGLILNGKQSSTLFNPDRFHGKYQLVMKDIKAGLTEEELYGKYTNLIQAAKHAAHSVNGLGTELDWVKVVDDAYATEVVIDSLQKSIKYFTMGDKDKASDLLRRATSTLGNSQKMRSMSADEVVSDYSPFMKSGTPCWDAHIGGFPTMGLVILAAKWGEGKTTAAIDLMDNFLKEHPEKDILFVTLEDMADGWVQRAKIILGARSNDFWHRVKIMEFASTAEEVIQEAARYPDVGMIFLDYVDYLAKNKDLATYDEIYKTLSLGAKSLAVSSRFKSMVVVALAQFGRGAYQGGVPSPAALMYSGEQYAYQLVMLYDPNKDYHSDNPQNPYTLPSEKGYGYVCVFKVKNGCKPHLDSFPGAIKVPMSTRGGFNLGADGTWFSLAAETKRETVRRK